MPQVPIASKSIVAETGKSIYPEPFTPSVKGRKKRKLGDLFELSNIGVNLTELLPGAVSALMHHHSKQDEFIYILEGTPTLRHGAETFILKPGDCFGFKGGSNTAHQIVNQSSSVILYLEIGDRSPGDEAEFPDDDLKATQLSDGVWRMTHKDGSEY